MIFLFLLHLPSGFIKAQGEYLPGKTLKYSLLDMVTFTGSSFLLSYEQPFNKRFSVQLEGGYAISPDYGFFGSSDNKNINGYKIKGELRYYLQNNKTSFSHIGLQFMYHSLSGRIVDDFCRDGCNYFQQIEYEKDFSNRGVHFINGLSTYVAKNVLFEAGYFLGVRIRKQYDKGIPDDAEQANDDSGSIFGTGKFILPAVGFYMRIGLSWQNN